MKLERRNQRPRLCNTSKSNQWIDLTFRNNLDLQGVPRNMTVGEWFKMSSIIFQYIWVNEFFNKINYKHVLSCVVGQPVCDGQKNNFNFFSISHLTHLSEFSLFYNTKHDIKCRLWYLKKLRHFFVSQILKVNSIVNSHRISLVLAFRKDGLLFCALNITGDMINFVQISKSLVLFKKNWNLNEILNTFGNIEISKQDQENILVKLFKVSSMWRKVDGCLKWI